jgi:hypothetical protein
MSIIPGMNKTNEVRAKQKKTQANERKLKINKERQERRKKNLN